MGASTSDKVILLFSLVPYLLENGATPVKRLAEHFGFAEDVIRRLAVFIGTAGIPGETLTYQHEDMFDINWDALEMRDELELVQAIAIDDSPRFSAAETAALMAGLQMLMGVLDEKYREKIESLQHKLAGATQGFEPSLAVDTENLPVFFEKLLAAVTDQQRVKIQYTSKNGRVTERKVDPYVLKQRGGRWYLKGFCHLRDAERIFSVDAISDLLVTTETFQKSAEDEFLFNIKGDSGSTLRAVIAVTPRAYKMLEAWQLKKIGLLADGRIKAEIELVHESRALELVASHAGEVEVLEPSRLRGLVAAWAREALT